MVLDQQLVELIPLLENTGKEIWILSDGKGLLWRYAFTHSVDPSIFTTWWLSTSSSQQITDRSRFFYDIGEMIKLRPENLELSNVLIIVPDSINFNEKPIFLIQDPDDSGSVWKGYGSLPSDFELTCSYCFKTQL